MRRCRVIRDDLVEHERGNVTHLRSHALNFVPRYQRVDDRLDDATFNTCDVLDGLFPDGCNGWEAEYAGLSVKRDLRLEQISRGTRTSFTRLYYESVDSDL
jgi:hypothetical protein